MTFEEMAQQPSLDVLSQHVDRVWCANVRCGKCYHADRWNALVTERVRASRTSPTPAEEGRAK